MSEFSMADYAGDFLKRMEVKLMDPEYQQKLAEQKAHDADVAAREQARRDRRYLMDSGVPMKDIEPIVRGELGETRALSLAREWWPTDSVFLVLSGTRGCGKTTAAAWIVAQQPRETPWRHPNILVSLQHNEFYESPLFMDVSKLARTSRYSEKEMSRIERAATLAVDDLGMEYADTKGAFGSLFDGLFNARYAERLKTVITTNLTSADFRTRYGERVIDRIRESGQFVELDDASLRGRRS